MDYELILVEKEDGIGKIVLNNGPLNILNITMMKEINKAIDDFSEDDLLKALIFDHEGKAFSAGVDVGDHMGEKATLMLEVFHEMFKKLNSIKCPTIAITKGAALGGGCELAIFCDIILSSDKAKFGNPEIKVGVFPPVSVVVFPYLIGHKKTYELLLGGETIDAKEAHRLGLVNHVFPIETFEVEITKFLKQFTSLSTTVLRYTKKAIKIGLGTNFEAKLDQVEDLYLNDLMTTYDANEGLKAFMEKRKPEWQNR